VRQVAPRDAPTGSRVATASPSCSIRNDSLWRRTPLKTDASSQRSSVAGMFAFISPQYVSPAPFALTLSLSRVRID